MEICLMIEGQEGVAWEQWVALAGACEEAGLHALFRSDHYVSVGGDESRPSLDAWASLAALAARTSRIRLGTLVSPATFRHPSVTAKMAATVDHVSGGRVELGLGAGWYDREHEAYGFPFPDDRTRLDMLAEQLAIVVGQWTTDDFTFEGKHYRTDSVNAQPKPLQQPHPPVIVGGSGGRRSISLAARWAIEYNTLFAGVEDCRARRIALEEAYDAEGRDPAAARLSLMTPALIGTDRAEVEARAETLAQRRGRGESGDEVLARMSDYGVVGTIDEARARLEALADVGVERVMLQHLVHDDLDTVALMADLASSVP